MNQDLKRVIYVSEHNEYSNNSLKDIINSSRENNPGQDITGCLISGSNSFLQLLEGPVSFVDNLYLKIKQDDRHMIIDEKIETRLFSSWSMKLDPFNNLMWSDEDLNAGNFLNLTSQSALNIFTRISEDVYFKGIFAA